MLLAALIIGCAPGPTTTPVPAPAPTPEPTPEAPVLPVHEQFPPLAALERVEPTTRPPWLSEGATEAFIRVDGRCRRLTLEPGARRTEARLPLCRRRGRTRITCVQRLRIDERFEVGRIECSQTDRQGGGFGTERPGDAEDVRPSLGLVLADAQVAVYAPLHKAHVTAQRVQLVEAPCLPYTAEQARDAYRRRHPEIEPAALAEAMQQRHGLGSDDARRCPKSEGLALHLVPAGQLQPEVAIDPHRVQTPVDCRGPCPIDPAGARAAAYRRDLRRTLWRDRSLAAVTVFRDEAQCQRTSNEIPAALLTMQAHVCRAP